MAVTMPPFMSNTPGPVDPPVDDREWPHRQRAEWEHRVVMADDEHRGVIHRRASARADRPYR